MWHRNADTLSRTALQTALPTTHQEDITNLTIHATEVLSILRTLKIDFSLVSYRIRLQKPVDHATKLQFVSLARNPRFQTTNEDWLHLQKTIPYIKRELEKVVKRREEFAGHLVALQSRFAGLRRGVADVGYNPTDGGVGEEIRKGLEEVHVLIGGIERGYEEARVEEGIIVGMFAKLTAYLMPREEGGCRS